MQRLAKATGRWLVGAFAYIGGVALLTLRFCATLPRLFSSLRLIVAQMLTMGVQSLPLVILVAIFVGAVSAWQAAYQFQGYLPMRYLGGAVGKAILIELAPVLTALVMAGRVGAAIAAELGTMRVTEQIDALEVMGIDPVRYLVLPRVVSGVIMLPILVLFANFVAVIGALLVAVVFVDMSGDLFLNGFKLLFRSRDLMAGLIKSGIFGLTIAMIGCHQGFTAKGGAAGVGQAATGAVVVSSVLILVSDYMLATFLFQI